MVVYITFQQVVHCVVARFDEADMFARCDRMDRLALR